MKRQTENKIILVVRETRLEELKARFNTVSQARFYVERLGGDFRDYEQEDRTYHQAVSSTQTILAGFGRVQAVPRKFLPNFIFGPNDLAVAVGQDGLVANTLKYLEGQFLIGVNPDPARYDGKLLPFEVRDLEKIIPEVFRGRRPIHDVTMARAKLNNGQTLHAVNDLFVGPKSHGSARYSIKHGGQEESHSSSGVIISTGLGSTGWLTSLITGAQGITAAFAGKEKTVNRKGNLAGFAWDAKQLCFTVREPFPSKTTNTTLLFGRIPAGSVLSIESHMAERGVIFSDGIEADFLEFNSGTKAVIGVADRVGRLVA
jgi:NAD kinase